MSKSFLIAEWRKLIMANYAVAPEALEPFRPSGTTLNLYEGQCYVSLVGFLFQDTRLKSIPIPFHRTFEEVNLRFYVQRTTENAERRRGVVVHQRACSSVRVEFGREHYLWRELRNGCNAS